MDPVIEIKSRLPIEELVGGYCQLKKKGRSFVTLCPFHNDTHPSMQIAPEKGIAYCFVCQTGGDIFSFYQSIEGVDFRQALNDLAERTGVTIEAMAPASSVEKDEKERARACLEGAEKFYTEKLKSTKKAVDYLKGRSITGERAKTFGIGYAPDSFSDTYQHLLKKGFSRKEILTAGLGVQKELSEGKIYDRFRNRIMFPVHDARGQIAGFGGRTLGEDDAKYINSAEGPLYNKSQILYGLHLAKESIRETKKVILVEGYFDVIACHSVGIANVVAASGTALTEQHSKILKRYADKIILCLDQDQAGRDASERAFKLCMKEGLQVSVVVLPEKDPAQAAEKNPDALKKYLVESSVPYMDLVLEEVSKLDLGSAAGKREGLTRILPLLDSIPSSVEREHELTRAAGALGTTLSALSEDVANFHEQSSVVFSPESQEQVKEKHPDTFSRLEVALGLFLIYPKHRVYIKELIAPEEGFPLTLFEALKEVPDEVERVTADMLKLPKEHEERLAILFLYCEHHEFVNWSEGVVVREIRASVVRANRETLREKQKEISKKLLEAHREGKETEAEKLSLQYQQVLKLTKKAS